MAFPVFNKAKANDPVQDSKESTAFQKQVTVTQADVQRLAENAGRIVAMFENVKQDPAERLMLAAGMAGFACHQAVKANHEPFVELGTKDGMKFYYGDAVNFYLLENPFCVWNFLVGCYQHMTGKQDVKEEISQKVHALVKQGVENIANKDFMFQNRFHPTDVYLTVQDCWGGIYQNMTGVYCKSADEWSVLFAIVLQNVLMHMEGDPEQLLDAAMEYVLYVSKMDILSVRKKEVMQDIGEEQIYNFYEDGVKVQLSPEDETFIHDAVDMLREFFKENKCPFDISIPKNELSRTFHFKMEIHDEMTDVIIKVDLKPRFCYIVFVLPFGADMAKLPELCTEICKMNYGQRAGTMQVDVQDGQLTMRAGFVCGGGLLKDDFLRTFLSSMKILSGNMETLKRYARPSDKSSA